MKELLNWNSFSKYRNQLFGIAIILILLFHSTIFVNYGKLNVVLSQFNLGVEMFLFLSGMGLYFSYSKKPGYLQFEKKRFLTVGIVYLIISLPFCIWQNTVQNRSFLYFLFDLSSISYWFKTENSPGWYVSLILILYIIYPLLYKFIFGNNKNNYRAVIVTSLIIVAFVASIYFLSRKADVFWLCVERAYTRIPVFVLGCYCGKLIYEKQKFGIKSALFFAFCLLSVIGMNSINFRLRYFLTVLPIMFGMILIIYLLVDVFRIKLIGHVLEFFGGITLELYLVHNYISEILQYYNLRKPIYYLITVVVSVPASYAFAAIRRNISTKNKKKVVSGSK